MRQKQQGTRCEGGGVLTWWRTEALLRARVGDVNAPGISKEGNAAQGAHCVHNQQGAILLTQLAQPF